MTDVHEPVNEAAPHGADPGDGDAVPGGTGPRRSHLARNLALAVGAVLVLLIAVLATGKPPGETPNSTVGHRVPALAGPTLDGRYFDIDDVQNRIDPSQGKWLLVNFLASWCIGCEVEHPELVEFAKRHPDDVQVVGVAYKDTPEKLRDFFQLRGGTWPVVFPERKDVAVDFGVTALPESFLVRPDGMIVAWSPGVTLDWLERALAENGGGPAAAPSPDGAPSTTGAPR
jgi:cytochrome c biogenesis protein CcmG/thiol:disulfide interchange protein DsbE